MTEAKTLFEAGKLDEAIAALLGEVKAAPNDISRRTFLFELSCFAGDWERAERQLDVIAHQSAEAEVGAEVYRNLIRAERDRRRLISDSWQPHFLTEPPAYVDLHMEAINRLREGNYAEARAKLDAAEEERPALGGRLDGATFEDLRDYDDLLAPVLEVIVQDKYTWLPFEQVTRVEIEAPKSLRELLWLPAIVETRGEMLKGFLPTLYPGSSEHAEDAVKLGRMTDWRQAGEEELYLGAGLHLLAVDGEEKPLLEVRNLEFDAVVDETQHDAS